MAATEVWGQRDIGGTMRDAERLAIRYAYQVKGRQYESTRIAFFTIIIYPQTLQFAEQHPVDSPVSVWYEPDKPGESVVIPGLNPAWKSIISYAPAQLGAS